MISGISNETPIQNNKVVTNLYSLKNVNGLNFHKGDQKLQRIGKQDLEREKDADHKENSAHTQPMKIQRRSLGFNRAR
jgi:hypothetical protein